MDKKWYEYLSFTNVFCMLVFNWCMIFFFYIMHQSFNNPKAELPNEADQIMIAVIGFGSAVIGYVVGSNKASAKKDEIISKSQENISSALQSPIQSPIQSPAKPEEVKN